VNRITITRAVMVANRVLRHCRGMAFREDTAVRPAAPDTYTATMSDRWDSVGGMPNGGYLLAVASRAIGNRLGRPDPVTVSGLFLRRGRHGPAMLRTEVLKSGKRFAFGSALLTQDGQPTVHAHAAFGDLGGERQQLFSAGSAPVLPDPEHCVDILGDSHIPGVSIIDRVEYRMPEMPGWVKGAPDGDPSAELWLRLRDGDTVDVYALPMVVDCMMPVVVDLGLSSTTVELTVHVRARPAPGWLACRVATRYVAGGLHEEDVEMWDSRGMLVAQSRQLAMLLG
jgi:acyl-CoA thioesterase